MADSNPGQPSRRFLKIPEHALRHLGAMGPGEWAVLSVICWRRDHDTNAVAMFNDDLADQAHVHEKSVPGILAKLASKKLIVVESGVGRGRKSTFRVMYDPHEETVAPGLPFAEEKVIPALPFEAERVAPELPFNEKGLRPGSEKVAPRLLKGNPQAPAYKELRSSSDSSSDKDMCAHDASPPECPSMPADTAPPSGRLSRAALAEQIYEAYPRKREPEAAAKAIEKALARIAARGQPPTWLFERVRLFGAAWQRRKEAGEDTTYTKNPATWMNKGCYDEDAADWEPSGAAAPRPAHQMAGTRPPPAMQRNLDALARR